MIYDVGATSVSVDIFVADDSGLAVTGLVASTMPTVKYSKAGANADATITLADLVTITTAWASGGIKERGEGYYRLDLPNAIFTVAGVATIRGEATDKHVILNKLQVDLTSQSLLADLGSNTITIANPVASDGTTISVVQGAAYNSTYSRQIALTFVSSLTLSAGTVTLVVGDGKMSVTMTATNVSTTWTLTAQPTAAQTSALGAGIYPYQVWFEPTGAEPFAIISGDFVVTDDERG